MSASNSQPLGVPSELDADGAVALERPRDSLVTGLMNKLAGLRFLTFSALFHIILLAFVGGTVLYKQMEETPDFAPDGPLVTADQTVLPPQNEQVTLVSTPTPSVSPSTSAAAPSVELSAITSSVATASFAMNAMPQPVMRTADPTKSDMPAAPATLPSGLTKTLAVGIANFSKGWSKPGGKGGPLKNREFEFNAYLAKYAGGDWSSTVRIDQNEIVQGSLTNLLFVMSKLSRDKITGTPQAKPLDLASQEIFDKKPPFIFFTGHRDFVLTEQEVLNLRQYIMLGGCLWGDSSLPGQRSRFDLAFRREMRRVIPDINKDWKQLPANHPIYTKSYYPDITEPPPGINFYHEPIYAIPGMAGEIGVLYTPNDYGDMWQFGIDEHGDLDTSRDEKHRMIAINEPMYYLRNVYFRNIEPKALMKTYKFGTNIAIHLMTRWEDKIGMAGSMPQ